MYRIGKIYIPDGASARRIRASFNAASMSDDSIRAFAGTDFLNADAALRRSVRLLIAARARNEFANNSFAYGIVTTLANDTIGKGPHLQLVHTDDAEGVASPRQEAKLQRRERRFARWARAVKLTSILRCARIAKAIDGETFLLLSENRAARREITLQPSLVECEKIHSPRLVDQPTEYRKNGTPIEVDGVEMDDYGNPVAYNVWNVHPGAAGAFNSTSRRIDARNVIHYANIFRADQHRGVSEMLAALNIFNDLRRYSTAVVLAAEIAARLSFIISNDLPPENYDQTVHYPQDEKDTFQSALDLQGGPGRYEEGAFNSLVLPAGYRASQMQPQQPTNNYVTFRDAKINEAARVFSMPFNVAVGNSSSYNYASGRLDHQVYRKAIDIERETIETDILAPIYDAWEERDRLLHMEDYRGADDVEPTIMWDGWEHVDPVKEANAQAIRLSAGVTTLSEECAREGRDHVTIIHQRRREADLFRQNGLNLPAWFGQAPQPVKDEEDKD